jgi:uncharacterized protein (TIGR00369 family)
MEDLREYLEERLRENHFIQYMGLKLTHLEIGYAEMTLDIEKHHLQQNGFTHGGVTATILDVVTGIVAYTTAAKGKNVVTADLKVSYLNPSTASKILATGKVKKSGNFLIFCEGELFDIFEDGSRKLVATCNSIMCAIDIPIKVIQ